MNDTPRENPQEEKKIAGGRARWEDAARDRSRGALGTVLLFLGLGILGLLAADGAGGLPFSMPRSWYVDRSLWVAGGLAAIGGAWYLLGDRRRADEGSTLDSTGQLRPGRRTTVASNVLRSGVRFRQVVVYTRPGCHLCEVALATLQKYAGAGAGAGAGCLPPPTEIDIDGDPALVDRYSTCVPVVEIDQKIRFRGRVNEVLLRRLIDATPPQPAIPAPAPPCRSPIDPLSLAPDVE